MKTDMIFEKFTGAILFMLIVASMAFVSSCKEDEAEGEPYFTIENNPAGLTAGMDGKTEKFVVRSNRPWKIVAKEEGDVQWVRSFPSEGDQDGKFTIIVEVNNTFVRRIQNFAFIVDGEEQPVLFRVEQEANTPSIKVDPVSVPAAGGEVNIAVKANIDWTYTMEENSWLTEKTAEASKLVLNAERNNGKKRSVKLTFKAVGRPEVSQVVTVEQSPGTIVLEEDFSWLAYGSPVPYVTTGETRYDAWTQAQRDRGWTSTVNTAAGSGNTPMCYARQGFVKLGKTGYGGDLISPKLSDIEGTRKLKVTFKAAAYVSAAGTVVDTRVLKIIILGAGIPSTDVIMVENVPNIQKEDEAGVQNDIWADDRAFSFEITGATSETQIKFLGKDYDLTKEEVTTNRIFLDDIKVEIVD